MRVEILTATVMAVLCAVDTHPQAVPTGQLRTQLGMEVTEWDSSSGNLRASWSLDRRGQLGVFKVAKGRAGISLGSLELEAGSRLELRELASLSPMTVSFEVLLSDERAGLLMELWSASSGRAVAVRWSPARDQPSQDGLRRDGGRFVDVHTEPSSVAPGAWTSVQCEFDERLRVTIGERTFDAGFWKADAFALAFRSGAFGSARIRELRLDDSVVPDSVRKMLHSATAAAKATPKDTDDVPFAVVFVAVRLEEMLERAFRHFPEMPWEKTERREREREIERARRNAAKSGFRLPDFKAWKVGEPWPMEVMSRNRDAHAKLVAARDAETKDRAGARALLEQAAELDPEAAIIPYLLGTLAERDKNPEEAARQYRQAVEKRRRFEAAWRALGLLALDDQDLEAAEEALLEARAASFKEPWGTAYLGVLALFRGDLDRARQFVGRAAGQRPKSKALLRLKEYVRRLQVSPDWNVKYTVSNGPYVVESNIVGGLTRRVGEDLARFRAFLETVFPLPREQSGKARVWVFDSEEEYLVHTDAIADRLEHTGGCYHPMIRTMLLFETVDDERNRRVLFHEAWHQYLHVAVAYAPLWFNEGCAEYFAATTFDDDGRPSAGGLLADRIATLRSNRAGRGSLVPFERLMRMSPRAFMDPRRGLLHYAQAWAMVHWLRRGGDSDAEQLFESYAKTLMDTGSGRKAWDTTFGGLPKKALLELDGRFAAYVDSVLLGNRSK